MLNKDAHSSESKANPNEYLMTNLPREISSKMKAYAFQRSLGRAPAEACRHAGGKVENGHATKWERSPRVRAWVEYFRSLGQTEEILAAKRALIEERLSMAANFNLFDFSTIDEFTKKPVIDWSKVADSPYGAVIAGFKFDKDSGVLTDFERDNALQALAQLRDMHGFKAPAKTAFTDPSGQQPAAPFVVEIVKFSDAPRSADKAAV
jgi:hypothetical protein